MVLVGKTSTYLFTCLQHRLFNLTRHFTFSTLSPAFVKRKGSRYLQTENEFAHNVLANLPEYQKSISPNFLKEVSSNQDGIQKVSLEEINIDWNKLSANELCDKFKNISVVARINSLKIEDESYRTMCSEIAERSSHLSDEILIKLLGYLSLWPFASSPKDKNFYILWKALDDVCLSRWKTWDFSKILLFTDLWYNLRLTRQSNYVYKSISKAAMNPNKLSSHQLVQLLFYLNVLRTISKGIAMYNVEYELEKIVRTLSIEEIGVAVMGFFKTEDILTSEKLLNYLMDRVIEEKQTIPEIVLSAILKVLRASLKISLWPRIPQFMDALETEVDRLCLPSNAHILLLAAKALTIHEGTLNKISQKLSVEIKTARLKDMEKVLFPLTLLNYNPNTVPCIYDRIVQELNDPNRASELNEHPKSLIALLYYLTLRDIFVETVAAKVLDMDFIRMTYGKKNFMIGREILGIDAYIELMKPPYSGPRLPVEIRNYLSKRYSTFLPDPNRKLSKHSKFTLDIFETAKELLGEQNVMYKYIVPHHSRADIVFNLSINGEPLPIPDDYRNIKDFTGPVKAPKNDGNWFALVIASRNMFVHNVPNVSGETSSKLNLIKVLGYKPVTVSHWEWPERKEEKLAYLKLLIQS